MKRTQLVNASKYKGELIMKRTIIALVLVTAFVFAFTAVAGAKYAGFTPIRTAQETQPYHPVTNPNGGKIQGFITFPEARVEMARNAVPATLANTAHGGYVTTSTKCAVCHSAHRASGYNPDAAEGDASGSTSGAINQANAQNQRFLTAGETTCAGCHVNQGAQASRLLVEWGLPNGGPHSAPNRGCTLCHNAGIHGLSSSSFNVMNAFMLGNTRGRGDNNSQAANTGIDRDTQIRNEINAGKVLRGGVLDIPTTSSFTRAPAAPGTVANGTGSTWWYDGARSLGAVGTIPGGSGMTGAQYGAARSLATAYTCSEVGCHVNTAMFNLNWGMGFERALYAGGTTTITGHVMPGLRATGSGNQACGPCHAGNPAGFPTASTVAGSRDISRQAYGCDQCHDMVGVATNSTAFPHGNRGILVYEWLASGEQTETAMTAGNLWMYAGNIARAAGTTGTGATRVTAMQGPTSANAGFADQSWFVLTGVTRGAEGIPGHPGFTGTATPGTGLVDGSCLKCHVAIDGASRAALNSHWSCALRHDWTQLTNGQPSWNGTAVTGSARLFLYR